jgi:ABC-type cobalamin/Fe3+-siderophores transport system ATPase subunit
LRTVEANLSHEKVSVLFGPNGCGKTSFLKIIHGVLSQDETALIQNNVSKVEITVSNNNEENLLKVEKNDEGQFDWTEILNSGLSDTSSLSLGVDRGLTSSTSKVDPGYILDFFRHPRNRRYLNNEISTVMVAEELSSFLRNYQHRHKRNKSALNLDKQHLYLQNIKIDNIEELLIERYRIARMMASRKIQSALFDTLAASISLDGSFSENEQKDLPEDFNDKLTENKARIIEALDDGSENKFKAKVIEILGKVEEESDVNDVKKHPVLSQLFLNIIEELDAEKLVLSSINLLVDTFNDYLIEGKKLVINAREVYIVVNNDKHDANDLSSGERHILTFLSLVLFEGTGRDFLIIDEPEISLNIAWQRELMSLFSDLIPETQIIVASHSPALVKGNPNFLTELVLGEEVR